MPRSSWFSSSWPRTALATTRPGPVAPRAALPRPRARRGTRGARTERPGEGRNPSASASVSTIFHGKIHYFYGSVPRCPKRHFFCEISIYFNYAGDVFFGMEKQNIESVSYQWIGFVGKMFTGKPHDLNGKITLVSGFNFP